MTVSYSTGTLKYRECLHGESLVHFARIVPGFLVQTGDKTGTGAGGESFYGGPSS